MHLESTDGIVKRDTSFNISVNGQSRGVAHGVAERDISENRSVDSDDPIKRISEVYVADATFYHQVPEHGTGNRNIPHKSLSVYVERRALANRPLDLDAFHMSRSPVAPLRDRDRITHKIIALLARYDGKRQHTEMSFAMGRHRSLLGRHRG